MNAKHQLDEFRVSSGDALDSKEQLENCIKQSREAELAERKLNTALHRQLEIEQENVSKLRLEITALQNRLDDQSSQSTDDVEQVRQKILEFEVALEKSRKKTAHANVERDRQCEEKLDLLAKVETVQKRENRMEEHIKNLEARLLNSSMNSGSGSESSEERSSLQAVRLGLEMARQQLSALSAR